MSIAWSVYAFSRVILPGDASKDLFLSKMALKLYQAGKRDLWS
jgi:hypothetical protein